MEKLLVLVLFLCMVSVAAGKVSTRVCLADGNTPFLPVDINLPIIKYPEVMVGTKLTIIVISDANGYWDWGGGLAIREADWDYGILSARDFNEDTNDWEGSRFEEAGENARVWDWGETGIGRGFQFSGDPCAVASDWFIIDYTALDVGSCTVGFYDFYRDWFNPVEDLCFTHVRTRDFNKDTKVDFADFAILASHWQATDCNDPNWCEGTDLDMDRNVDFNDVKLFTDYWLEKTEQQELLIGTPAVFHVL